MTHYQIARTIARLLDIQFSAGNFRFGLDPLLNAVPGLGSVVTFLLSLYIIWIAKSINVPDREIVVMVRNVVFDFVLGLIPVVGFIGDFFYKANIRNLKILERYADRKVIEGQIVR